MDERNSGTVATRPLSVSGQGLGGHPGPGQEARMAGLCTRSPRCCRSSNCSKTPFLSPRKTRYPKLFGRQKCERKTTASPRAGTKVKTQNTEKDTYARFTQSTAHHTHNSRLKRETTNEKKTEQRICREKGRGMTPLVSDVKSYFPRSSAGLTAVKLIFVFNVQCHGGDFCFDLNLV